MIRVNNKNKLVTTNVRIPYDELLTYREYALSEAKSFSQLVREALARTIVTGQETHAHIHNSKKRSFWDIGLHAKKIGDATASQKADTYIYTHE